MENVKQDTNIGTNILRVSASDEDADNNGAIVYNLTAYNSQDLEYFTILPESGWIVLIKPLDVSLFFFPKCDLRKTKKKQNKKCNKRNVKMHVIFMCILFIHYYMHIYVND